MKTIIKQKKWMKNQHSNRVTTTMNLSYSHFICRHNHNRQWNHSQILHKKAKTMSHSLLPNPTYRTMEIHLSFNRISIYRKAALFELLPIASYWAIARNLAFVYRRDWPINYVQIKRLSFIHLSNWKSNRLTKNYTFWGKCHCDLLTWSVGSNNCFCQWCHLL